MEHYLFDEIIAQQRIEAAKRPEVRWRQEADALASRQHCVREVIASTLVRAGMLIDREAGRRVTARAGAAR
ncbi:MAG TPA: hypothetical protein VFC53_09075 [Dehalococcoidia bacterium]|nr:hypothetical protein [Dehalococcoidia bacterium]